MYNKKRKTMKPIKFSPPDITRKEISEVGKALKSGWITTGPRVKQLEKVVASFCHINNCVCLNSQTACAEMTLLLLGIGPGDEVIVPAYTYTASCSVILHVGATPIIIDSQKNSFEMDYDAVEKAITDKTKVIIPVDLGGVMCDYNRIFEIIKNKQQLFSPKNDIQKAIGRIIVMADTAHALGAQYHGMMAGSIADFSCFSFHAVKNMTTAEGGAVTWKTISGFDDKEIYHKYQLLSLHGQSKDAFSKTQIGAWEYDVIGPWYKCNMTDVIAGIGIIQMKRYKSLLKKRQKIVDRYNTKLNSFNIDIYQRNRNDRVSSNHIYIVRLLDFSLQQRNEFIKKMGEVEIACNVHYKPLPMFSGYQKLGFNIKDYPNAFHLYENEVTLPLHTLLKNKDVERIIKSFGKIYNEIKNEKVE